MKITFNPNLSVAILQRATALAESIEQKQAELAALLSGQTVASRGRKSVSKCARNHTRTPEQRAAISAGLKAKWAARKAEKANVSAVPVASTVPATA